MLVTVLQFYLCVCGEAIGSGNVDPAKVWTPVFFTAMAIIDFAEYLLVPTDSTKELRRKLVFGFNVIGKRVRVSHVRNLKTSFVKLCPQLQVMPCETDVLS